MYIPPSYLKKFFNILQQREKSLDLQQSHRIERDTSRLFLTLSQFSTHTFHLYKAVQSKIDSRVILFLLKSLIFVLKLSRELFYMYRHLVKQTFLNLMSNFQSEKQLLSKQIFDAHFLEIFISNSFEKIIICLNKPHLCSVFYHDHMTRLRKKVICESLYPS